MMSAVLIANSLASSAYADESGGGSSSNSGAGDSGSDSSGGDGGSGGGGSGPASGSDTGVLDIADEAVPLGMLPKTGDWSGI